MFLFDDKSYSQDDVSENSVTVKLVELPANLSYLEAEQSLLTAYAQQKFPIHEMSVSYYDGSITLSGYVDFPDQVNLAEEMAHNTPGITKVYNYLVSKN